MLLFQMLVKLMVLVTLVLVASGVAGFHYSRPVLVKQSPPSIWIQRAGGARHDDVGVTHCSLTAKQFLYLLKE